MLHCPKCKNTCTPPEDSNKNYFIICPKCNNWLYFDKNSKQLSKITKAPPSYNKPSMFFSHSFMEEDKPINNLFADMLTFLRIPVFMIEYDTRPKDKVEKARELMCEADIVFVVLTKRNRCCDENNKTYWKVSDWIQNEIGMACAFDKEIIAIVEEEVKDDGMLKDIRYCYKFNRDNLFCPWIEDNPNLDERDVIYHLISYLETIQSWRKYQLE